MRHQIFPSSWWKCIFAPRLQVRTLFVSGLPVDIKPRELYLLFRPFKVSNNVSRKACPLWCAHHVERGLDLRTVLEMKQRCNCCVAGAGCESWKLFFFFFSQNEDPCQEFKRLKDLGSQTKPSTCCSFIRSISNKCLLMQVQIFAFMVMRPQQCLSIVLFSFLFPFWLGSSSINTPPTLVLPNQIGSGIPRTWMISWNV